MVQTNILKLYDVNLIIGILTMYTYRQHVRNKEPIICNVWVWDITLWLLHSYNELNKIQLHTLWWLNITTIDYM